MSKLKIIAVLAIIFLLITLCMQVDATENNPLSLNSLILSDPDTPSIDPNEITANNIAANEIAFNNEIEANEIAYNGAVRANEIAANSVIQPTVNTESTNSESLPQTGVTEDITVIFFIIVCTISAIYAYKKIREYNV